MRQARITGIERKTIRSYHQRWLADLSNSLGVATGSEAVATQIPPPWPAAPARSSYSLCEPHRDFIEAQLLLRRNAVSIYQDLADAHGFTAAYNSVKRFVRALRKKAPEQWKNGNRGFVVAMHEMAPESPFASNRGRVPTA